MILTYDEYDRMEEACDRIRETLEKGSITDAKYFDAYTRWPIVEVMEQMQVRENFDLYFPYLFFWYTQNFPADAMYDKNAYEKAMKYIRTLMEDNITFLEN